MCQIEDFLMICLGHWSMINGNTNNDQWHVWWHRSMIKGATGQWSFLGHWSRINGNTILIRGATDQCSVWGQWSIGTVSMINALLGATEPFVPCSCPRTWRISVPVPVWKLWLRLGTSSLEVRGYSWFRRHGHRFLSSWLTRRNFTLVLHCLAQHCW